MKTKHTPGPWESTWGWRDDAHGPKKGLHVWSGRSDGEPPIAEIPDNHRLDGAQEANARLIAAAPALLAALEAIMVAPVRPCTTDGGTKGYALMVWDYNWDDARAAIAAAKGEE
jgi:hypothetical protein